MAGQVSPGIVLRERDLTTQVIVNNQANTAAFVGSFEKGPVGTITNIATERELLDTFGQPNNNNYQDWFTASTFLSYGGQLQMVRIEDGNLKNAVSEVGAQTTDATKIYVTNASGFSSGNYVKIDNEYFVIGTVVTGGNDYLTVTTRGVLGSTQVDHVAGASISKWTYTNSATTTVVNESIDATETIITLTSSTGFTAGSYFKMTNNVDATTETVLINRVEGNDVIVTRGQLGTTAVAQPTSTITATLLTFAATTPTTTLSQAYPVVSTAAVSAPLIRSRKDYDLNVASYGWRFAARTAGAWANGIQVAWIDGSVASYTSQNIYGSVKWTTVAGKPVNVLNGTTTANEMHIVVLDMDNNVLESFTNVSRVAGSVDEQGNSVYYMDVIESKSQYIYAGNGVVSSSTAGTPVALANGVDSYVTDVSAIGNSYDLFADTEEITIDFILCGGSLANLTNQRTKAQKVISIAETRKDCIAFISPHQGFVSLSSTSAQRDAIIDFFSGDASSLSSSSYAIFDSGYKYVYDKYNDTYRYVPCNGDVAGLCVQTSANFEDWFSPAGVNRGNLKNVVKLAYVPTKTDRDKLYQARINPIVSFPGQGVILYGDKTALGYPSAFDRINVRRLFLSIERRIGRLAKSVLFELNDSSTRSSFANTATAFLSEIQSKRGVTDFLVVCDTTNNTPDVIDRNEFVAEIYVKPTRSINYITITFVATRTGVSFSEVTGR